MLLNGHASRINHGFQIALCQSTLVGHQLRTRLHPNRNCSPIGAKKCHGFFLRPSRHQLRIKVTAFTDSQSNATASSTVVYERIFQITNNSSISVTITSSKDGTQDILITSNLGGRLLMHWGVEGGKGYKGGWRLPGHSCRPQDTIEYKKRALQTPFTTNQNGIQEFSLHLTNEEASDYFDFVLKDTVSDTWYDCNGSNFKVPLKQNLASSSITNSQDQHNQKTSNTSSSSSAPPSSSPPRRELLPIDAIPMIPQDLSGVWSFMKWEAAGCPNRSQEEADHEYTNALQELALLLRQGVHLDALRDIATQGVQRYVSFMDEQRRAWESASSSSVVTTTTESPPPAPMQQKQLKEEESKGSVDEMHVNIPEEILNIKSYLLWEAAGKPDGADFSQKAKESILEEINRGKSIRDIENALRSPPPPPSSPSPPSSASSPAPPPTSSPPPPPPAAALPPKEQQQAYVGQGIGLRERNPLDLVHRFSPPKLADAAAVSKREAPLGFLIQDAGEDESCVWNRVFPLGSKSELLVSVWQEDVADQTSPVRVVLTTDSSSKMVLHWGVKKAGRSSDWKRPSESVLPAGSILIEDGIAAETPFTECDDDECHVEIGGALVPLQRMEVTLPRGHGLTGLSFVIRSEDSTRWWNDAGSNFTVPVPGPVQEQKESKNGLVFDDELSRIIVDCEVKTGAWTLMHRFNKAAELINAVVNGSFSPPDEAMAKIFIWLRYSAIRQITWQRNYNTQPRILGAAQERLTHAIADACGRLSGPAQEWARACLTTVGRGSNAQAVRDEILNIMHRNKISEVKGTWMEEFHQKLHNNTTPDDVPICEAYLAFLHADGNINAYWRTLSDNGITRARLESFDRPIVNEPVFFANKKENLIVDFGHYLGILKATHSGADLQASAAAAASILPGGAKGYLGYVLSHSNDPAVLPLIEAAVEVRTELASSSNSSSNRELIYLDLALENVVRAAAERGAAASGTGAAALLGPLLQNLALSLGDNEEICYCLKAWLELLHDVRHGQPPGKDEALRAMAVVDRIRRALSTVSDRVMETLGPVSSRYGEAFGCEPWAVQLFPEEVVRGGPAFAVSLVVSSIEPALRAAAELGAWHVISPASSVMGQVIVVPSMHGLQEMVYADPTVLVSRRVTGEEEVPVGVVAVLSGDAPDVLSHLSVRARNMGVLFAGCHDADVLEEVAALEGGMVELSSTAAGAVTWTLLSSDSDESSSSSSGNGSMLHQLMDKKLTVTVPKWSGVWAVGMDAFANGVVGAKSKNLAGLRGKLPSSINLPASVTVPFGSFEEALKHKENKDLAKELSAAIAAVTPATATQNLDVARTLASRIVVPEETQKQLKAAMTSAGIAVPHDTWDDSLAALRAVWASKYNNRAYISTRKVGIPFDDVRMAVLVQRVVPARYAFVIHTTNPMTGNENEIYCELVRGLGEAIVSGTVPGAALAFVASKDDLQNPRVLLYPSKSEGMFVADGSLIFRSDSNGEDLDGYAGAGLYDSITTAETVTRVVDYSSDPVVADSGFARVLMSRICQVGFDIEMALGSAQDVEGVVDENLEITVVQTRPQM